MEESIQKIEMHDSGPFSCKLLVPLKCQNLSHMYFATVLKNLYSGNQDLILEVINSSIYVDKYSGHDKTMLIHTGYSFLTQHNKRMILLYDLETQKIITQVQNWPSKLPILAGLPVTRGESRYFDSWYGALAIECPEDSNNLDFQLIKESEIYSYTDHIDEVVMKHNETNQEFTAKGVKLLNSLGDSKIIPFSNECVYKFAFTGSYYMHESEWNYYRNEFSESEEEEES